MEIFYRAETKGPQTYIETLDGGKVSAMVYCPDCGSPIKLNERYKIETTGKIVPAVHCTFPGCSFRDFSQLESWHRVLAQYLT